jgi:hypothetical protein
MSIVWRQAYRIAEISVFTAAYKQDTEIVRLLQETGTGYIISLPIPTEVKKNVLTLAIYIRNHALERNNNDVNQRGHCAAVIQ